MWYYITFYLQLSPLHSRVPCLNASSAYFVTLIKLLRAINQSQNGLARPSYFVVIFKEILGYRKVDQQLIESSI